MEEELLLALPLLGGVLSALLVLLDESVMIWLGTSPIIRPAAWGPRCGDADIDDFADKEEAAPPADKRVEAAVLAFLSLMIFRLFRRFRRHSSLESRGRSPGNSCSSETGLKGASRVDKHSFLTAIVSCPSSSEGWWPC